MSKSYYPYEAKFYFLDEKENVKYLYFKYNLKKIKTSGSWKPGRIQNKIITTYPLEKWYLSDVLYSKKKDEHISEKTQQLFKDFIEAKKTISMNSEPEWKSIYLTTIQIRENNKLLRYPYILLALNLYGECLSIDDANQLINEM